ncbi:anti-sigma-F factor Fin family protein [Fervidibacillus halotolerans]|uniref:Anti-sigma-F factor Fin family protein n=2 Tax=Fervidibacillus halotolerans TaxID=2980027 RepID=A0A9E8M2B7_9BACI|nr:anti-sigma-F factor Fin family protein [Fervidibacillus halotolerans]WAA14001.1 anti-sigma-F factor Fin family protein [Fervidibacillus halotolerans]
MVIHYICRYCGVQVGKLEGTHFQSEQLGFHKLTDAERSEMIEYNRNGDLYVKTICEDCYEAFRTNNDNYYNDYIIH